MYSSINEKVYNFKEAEEKTMMKSVATLSAILIATTQAIDLKQWTMDREPTTSILPDVSKPNMLFVLT